MNNQSHPVPGNRQQTRQSWLKPAPTVLALVIAALALAHPVGAATLVLTTNAPTPAANDVYNFVGGANDDANISGGSDQNTYVAPDRPTQGQVFTTGTSSSGGYLLKDIWIRHCGYTTAATSGNGTWWNLTSGAVYTLRVTDPAQIGQSGFVLSSETYTANGTEYYGARWNGGSASSPSLGDDVWLHFTLSTPLVVAAGTQYGIDLTGTAAGGGNYFEWLGNKTNGVFSGGSAYTGTAGGTPGNTVTMDTGARVFLVQLGDVSSVPQVAPVFTSANRFAPVGQTVQVTATIPSIANASNSATLNLTCDNPGVAAFSAGGDSSTTLTFAPGATNVQTFTVYVLGNGAATISVETNASFSEASISLGTPVSAEDPFDYAQSSALDQADGGTGFSGAWSEPSQYAYIDPGLTYGTDTTLNTSGNSVAINGGATSAGFRALPGTYGGVGGGTVYVGFLVNASYGLYDWAGMSLFTGTNSENLFMGEVLSLSPSNTWGFLQGSITEMNFPGSVSPGSQTDFLVYRIDFPSTNGGKALVSFYANPPLNSTEPFTATGSAYVNNFTFDHIRLGASTSDLLDFDEIRIGTQWTNVMQFTGTPEPLAPPTPALAAPAKFVPVGQTTAVTVSIPTNTPRPLVMTITNDNPASFSLSTTNAAETTLTFDVGGTNVQTLNVNTLAPGAATLTVVSNENVAAASLAIASQVSASDSFNYDAITDGLAGNLGGSGFDANGWTGGGSVVNPGLAYDGFLNSSNAAYIDASGSGNALRTLYTSSGNYGGVSGGTVWVSFLIKGAFPGTPQSAGVSLMNGTSTGFFMGLDTAQPNNGKWGYTGNGAGETSFDNSVVPSANTDLLVYRLDFPAISGGLVNVTFYADPPAGATPPTTPTGSGSVYNFSFNGIQLGTDFTMSFDEIHVGGSWAEVVPLAPSSPVLTVTRLSASQVQISWPTPASGTYSLMSSTNVLGPWTDAGLSIGSSGANSVSTDAISGNAKFYRLMQQ